MAGWADWVVCGRTENGGGKEEVQEQVQAQLQELLPAPSGAGRRRLKGGHAVEDRKLAVEGRPVVDAQPALLAHVCPVTHVEWDKVKDSH